MAEVAERIKASEIEWGVTPLPEKLHLHPWYRGEHRNAQKAMSHAVLESMIERRGIECHPDIISVFDTGCLGRIYNGDNHPETTTVEMESAIDIARAEASAALLIFMACLKDGLDVKPTKRLVSLLSQTSWGYHENYHVPQEVNRYRSDNGKFDDNALRFMAPFLASHISAGAGHISQDGSYYIMQKMSDVRKVTGYATTSDKPIVNTRCETLAGDGFGVRAHVTSSDMLWSPAQTATKILNKSAVLHLGELDHPAAREAQAWAASLTDYQILKLAEIAIKDTTFKQTVNLAGEDMTVLQVQAKYRGWLQQLDADGLLSPMEQRALAHWEQIDSCIARDGLRNEATEFGRRYIHLASGGYDGVNASAAHYAKDALWDMPGRNTMRAEHLLIAPYEDFLTPEMMAPKALLAHLNELPNNPRARARAERIIYLRQQEGEVQANWQEVRHILPDGSWVLYSYPDPRSGRYTVSRGHGYVRSLQNTD